MTYSLIWLPKVLLDAGLKVAETPGWTDRGRGDMAAPRGVMCHHTASRQGRNMPSLNILINGRPDLPGPLAQLGLGRDGTFYLIAAGRANHAGAGSWKGITSGNSSFIGIEAENDGLTEVWAPVQLDAYKRGAAAILRKIGAEADMCCGHAEYALPVGRKTDPKNIPMADFRADVHRIIHGAGDVRAQIEPVDAKQRPTLRRGSKDPKVEELQAKLQIQPVNGIFGAVTEARVRAEQRKLHLVPDGIVGPATWAALFDPPVAP